MTLALVGANVVRGGRRILDAVTLEVEPGRFTAVCGPNGAGKSTLLSVLAGSTHPTPGEARLDGRALAVLGPAALARRRAVLVQAPSLQFGFRVHEVVALGRLAHRGRTAPPEDDRVVAESMACAGVAPLAARTYTTLSGGERQRVQIARCLAQVWTAPAGSSSRWLLLDEPTTALDLKHQVAVMTLLRGLADDGWGVVANLHDLAQVRRWADRCVLMKAGRVVRDGTPCDALAAGVVADVFEVDRREAEIACGIGLPADAIDSSHARPAAALA